MNPTKPGVPTRYQILDLAKDDGIVAGALQAWRAGSLTWSEAMTFAVLALAEDRRRLRYEHVNDEMRSQSITIVPAPRPE